MQIRQLMCLALAGSASAQCGTCATGTCGAPVAAAPVLAAPAAPVVAAAAPTCGAPEPVVTNRPTCGTQTRQIVHQPAPQVRYQTDYQYVPGSVIPPAPITPPQQPPMFNLITKIAYEPNVKVFEHEIPYIHYEAEEKQKDCVKLEIKVRIEAKAKNIVRVVEEQRVKKALRVVQHFPEPITVNMPMYLGKIDETSQTAHHRMWFDLPVKVNRLPPDLQIRVPGAQTTPGHYVPVTQRIEVPQAPVVQNVEERVTVNQQVVQQPVPVPVAAPTCATGATGTCAAAAPVVTAAPACATCR